jgi:hypothetical protein
MRQKEFRSWVEFWKLYPFDDFHRFHRPASLIAHSMGGAKLDDLQAYLMPEPKVIPPELAGYSEADLRTFAAFGVTPPPRPAPKKPPLPAWQPEGT